MSQPPGTCAQVYSPANVQCPLPRLCSGVPAWRVPAAQRPWGGRVSPNRPTPDISHSFCSVLRKGFSGCHLDGQFRSLFFYRALTAQWACPYPQVNGRGAKCPWGFPPARRLAPSCPANTWVSALSCPPRPRRLAATAKLLNRTLSEMEGCSSHTHDPLVALLGAERAVRLNAWYSLQYDGDQVSKVL